MLNLEAGKQEVETERLNGKWEEEKLDGVDENSGDADTSNVKGEIVLHEPETLNGFRHSGILTRVCTHSDEIIR